MRPDAAEPGALIPRNRDGVDALVVALAVVVRDVLPHRPPESAAPEEDHPFEALGLDRQDDAIEHPAVEDLGLGGESAALVVVQPERLALHLLHQDAVLLD